MVSNILHNLLDYENEYIENISKKEQVIRNALSLIDASINKNVILRQNFDISEDGKILNNLKNLRRNEPTLISNAT